MGHSDGSGLTRRGWSLFGAAIGLLIGSRLLGAVELAMLAIVALVLIAASTVWTARRTVPLRAGRSIRPRRGSVGDDVRVDLVVSNTGARRTPVQTIADLFADGRRAARFVLSSLPSGERASAAYRVPTRRRGRFALGPLVTMMQDPFGLVRRRATLLDADELLVRPRVHLISVPPLAGGSSSSRVGDARSLIGEGDEFRALREYELGDDLRQIHWRSSARHDQLIIRQHEAHRQARAVVFLDLWPDGYDRPSFERAVEATASAVFSLGRSRRDVELALSSGEVVRAGTDAILDHLAVIEPSGPDRVLEVLGRHRRRALTIVITAQLRDALTAPSVELGAHGPVVVVTTGSPGTTLPGVRHVDASSRSFADAWDQALLSWSNARSRSPARR